MSLRPTLTATVPEETARIARSSFPQGHPYLALRDALGPLFADTAFLDLYAHQGPAGISAAQLAVITLLEFRENLSDEETVHAVRSRLDWKYLLALPVDYAGFDASVLSEFRRRLQPDGGAMRLLTRLIEHARSQGLVRERGMQRTDSTHVVAAVRRLNRLQLVQETMRHVLDAVSLVAPSWLGGQVSAAWGERYGNPFTRSRLPRSEAARQQLSDAIGQDGTALLAAIDAPGAPTVLPGLEAVQTLRRIWRQQYEQTEKGTHLRPTEALDPAADLECSPYDADVRYAQRHGMEWMGYLAHLTETCEPDLPPVILQVETTSATTPDNRTLPIIQEDLARRSLSPGVHLADSGYVNAQAIVTSATTYGSTLVGPARPDSSWQARANAGYDLTHFPLDWEQQQATCPEGKTSSSWREITSSQGIPIVQIHFRRADCAVCPVRPLCTTADRRSLTVHRHSVHAARIAAQAAQQTAGFQTTYSKRAGIERTISVAVRTAGLRRTRFRTLAKVRLEHLFIAAGLNLERLALWFHGVPTATTRQRPFIRFMALAFSP